jgi:hypothetical protein
LYEAGSRTAEPAIGRRVRVSDPAKNPEKPEGANIEMDRTWAMKKIYL